MREKKEIIEKMQSQNKCGFVSLVGEPNAGKSTLLNIFMKEKISIVSPKVQTTRHQVRGILSEGDTQVVFIDTPGFFKPKTSLEKALVKNFKTGYKDSDLVILIIDGAAKEISRSIEFLDGLINKNLKVAICINKVDIAKKEIILEIADKISKYDFIDKVFMISATKEDGVLEVKNYIFDNMPESHWMYDEHQTSDMLKSQRATEITREKLFNELQKELPYNIYVENESFKEGEKKIRIYQSIVVLKDSQKGIIIGKDATRIKKVKELAIRDLEKIFSKKIELKLFVKVKEKWTEKKAHLQNAGIINY